jgi:nicotinamide-nucleotide amidase
MSAEEVLLLLDKKGIKVALAESLTGGLLCSELVKVPGASNVVLGSIVAYQTGLKTSALGVNQDLLKERGPVDPEVAIQMAEGVRSRFSLQLMISTDKVIGVSTTGVAGPLEQEGIPVGTVFISVVGPKGAKVWEEHFTGDRTAVRLKTVEAAFLHIREYFSS